MPDQPPRLAAVPEPDEMPKNKRTVLLWTLALSEPLMPFSRRAQIESDMASLISRSQHWAVNWFAGFLHDVASTLPSDDPWKKLSAVVDLNAISGEGTGEQGENRIVFRNRDGVKPKAATGAYRPDGVIFGTLDDISDLVVGELGPADTELALTAVSDVLSPLASAVVGFSFGNIEALAATLSKVYHHLWLAEFSGKSEVIAGRVFLDEVGTALRWLIHRRWVYTDREDKFVTAAGIGWIARADRITGSGRAISGEVGLAHDARIDKGTYRDLSGDWGDS